VRSRESLLARNHLLNRQTDFNKARSGPVDLATYLLGGCDGCSVVGIPIDVRCDLVASLMQQFNARLLRQRPINRRLSSMFGHGGKRKNGQWASSRFHASVLPIYFAPEKPFSFNRLSNVRKQRLRALVSAIEVSSAVAVARVGDCLCDGFRMPANADLSTGTRAGVRKPPRNETAGSRAPGGSASAMGNWLAPLLEHGP
jgi:hypothetical protein